MSKQNLDFLFSEIEKLASMKGSLMNQAQYTQFLLAQRSLEEIKYMRDHPSQFSTGTCTLWGINERQRVEAVLTVIAILEKQQ